MTIDAKRLEEAIKYYDLGDSANSYLGLLRKAASAHLATLPRTKEIEVVQWAVLDGERVKYLWDSEEVARKCAYANGKDYQVIRLSGTATVQA